MSAPQGKHILVVEDEGHLAHGIKFNLQQEGYQVSVAEDGPAALSILRDGDAAVDLMVLDLMLPGMSGYRVCEALREEGLQIPVLILSARTLAEDRTRGFDVGADQYMTKPFDLEELISRVRRLLLRSVEPSQTAVAAAASLRAYEFAGNRIDFEKFECQVSGKPVRLTKKLFSLLKLFVENEGRVVPREELLEKVWRLPGYLNTRAPDQFIRRLRKIFESDPASPRHFLTIRDAGYRFVANPPDHEPPEGAEKDFPAQPSQGSE